MFVIFLQINVNHVYFSLSDGRVNVTLSEEKRLVHFLMRRYRLAGRRGRPVLNYTHPIKVEFGLGLIQMELNEKAKMLITSMWSRFVSSLYELHAAKMSYPTKRRICGPE